MGNNKFTRSFVCGHCKHQVTVNMDMDDTTFICPNCGNECHVQSMFEKYQQQQNQPLYGSIPVKINNIWAILLSIAPIAFMIASILGLSDIALLVVASMVNMVLFGLDISEVNKDKSKDGLWKLWGLILIPVYLFVRAYKVDKNTIYL